MTEPEHPAPGTPEFEALFEVWDALAEGDAEGALRSLDAVPAEVPLRDLAESAARTVLGDVRGARAAMERGLEGGLDEDDMDVLRVEGELLLSEWRVEDAADVFRRLSEMEESAAWAFERLALCHDLLRDPAASDEAMARACALDPEHHAPPARLAVRDFQEVVLQVIGSLEEAPKEILGRSEVIVAPVPARELESEPGSVPPDVLGLFMGLSELERGGNEDPVPTPVIYLFKRNIERASGTLEELREQITVTLLHELGHLLGFDEEGVEEMGLS